MDCVCTEQILILPHIKTFNKESRKETYGVIPFLYLSQTFNKLLNSFNILNIFKGKKCTPTQIRICSPSGRSSIKMMEPLRNIIHAEIHSGR